MPARKPGSISELKSVTPSVFFSSDVSNPETMSKFYADLEMWAFLGIPPDPDRLAISFHSRGIPSKENKWQGFNVSRYVNHDYDGMVDAAKVERDPVKRASLYIKANDLLWQDSVVIPVVHRFKVAASSHTYGRNQRLGQ